MISSIEITDAAETGAFTFSVNLDGIDYQLSFRFNSREGFWYFDLLDVAGEIIRSGIKCVINFPLIRLVRDATRPAGELMCFDGRTNSKDPGLNDFGIDNVLIYVDKDQVP